MAAPTVLIDTTFSGKNISTAVSVYEYTVAADATLRFQVRLAAVAGNGDYVAHLALNDGDAQTDDAIGPRTTYPAASGETAFWFASMPIDAIAGDVINVFILGQAGDTDEAGTIRIFSDGALAPTTAGRTLDVTATGEAGLDWANIGAPTTAVNLSGTTVKTATDLDFALTRGTSPVAGAVNQITLQNTALGVAGSYVHNMIALVGGTGLGQARLITAYTAGRVATVVPNFDTVPANDTVYVVLPIGQSYVNEFMAGAITAAAIATDAIDADALALDAITEIQAGLSTYAGTDTPGTTTLLTRLTAARAGYLDILAGWTGTLLAALRALARKDVAANADIAGTHSPATDSEEALSETLATLAPGGAVTMNAEITEIHVS